MPIISLILSIIIAQLAGLIGSFFTTPNISSWYTYLTKPDWNPPAWLFAPVWLSLYALMGVAAWLIWQKRSSAGAHSALAVYALQLILNTLWSIIFFGGHNIGLALAEIILLLTAIIITIILFGRISRAAAWLLLPYVLWVTFASYLNYTLWQLN